MTGHRNPCEPVAGMVGVMQRAPMTTQRSAWKPCDGVQDTIDALTAAGATEVEMLWRNVHDGQLRVIVANEPTGWHLSISHARTPRKKHAVVPLPGRYPTWDEIADARYLLCPLEIDMVMHLPPPGEYVALHETTFHLHEAPERTT